MFNVRPFKFSFIILVLVLVLHVLGTKFFLYWSYPKYDVVVHILGGVWVASFSIWLSIISGIFDKIHGYRSKALFIAVFSVTFVSVAWEIFELVFGITVFGSSNYLPNSFSDILSGLVGGVIGYMYFVKRKTPTCINNNCLNNYVIKS